VSLSHVEENVLAYYVSGAAGDLSVAPRWYPHGELILIVADKIEVALRPFGRKVRSQNKGPAAAFLDYMIAKGAFSTTTNDFGGTMHQFQGQAYKQALEEWRSSDPIIGQAQAAGEGFWQERFAALGG
jgi:hypothetical protein